MNRSGLKPTDEIIISVADFETRYISRQAFDEQKENVQRLEEIRDQALARLIIAAKRIKALEDCLRRNSKIDCYCVACCDVRKILAEKWDE